MRIKLGVVSLFRGVDACAHNLQLTGIFKETMGFFTKGCTVL